MRKAALSLLCLTLAALAWPASAKPLTVVELFTSQGCSSCGAANGFVAALADRPDVLPLTFSVDYWDYLGWDDTFAKPEFAARQRAYAKALGLREVYTPQVVIDGRAQAPAVRSDAVDKLVTEAARRPHDPPEMVFLGEDRVAVGSGKMPRGGAEVWLVRYDPREQDVEVKKGENRGKTIVHRNVVRELVKLGPWAGRSKAYRLPPAQDESLRAVVILQGAKGGRILGSLSAK